MAKRYYALINNIDLRMLHRQKARIPNIIDQTNITHNDKQALFGILNLLDAITDNAKLSSINEGKARNDAQKGSGT